MIKSACDEDCRATVRLKIPDASDVAALTNPCKLCAPLGACVAFKGVEGCIPLIHGSQGCATYIRRYLISHFREPVDIASSCFVESATVFGGANLFNTGLDNLISQYRPKMVGICTNCLSETIGEDLRRMLQDYRIEHKKEVLPALVAASTPSYTGTHADGFHIAVRSMLAELSLPGLEKVKGRVNLLPGFVSPGDLDHLKEVITAFGLDPMVLPDYSETLDGGFQEEYSKLPEGGTPVERIKRAPEAEATIQFGRALAREEGERLGGGVWLERSCGVNCYRLGMPIGLRESDEFFHTLSMLSGKPVPARYKSERSRLLDSYVDGHKYLFGKRAVVYGDEDMVIGLASFLAEIGVNPVLCASGGISTHFADSVHAVTRNLGNTFDEPVTAINDVDFDRIFARAEKLKPDLIIGSSKGYKLARDLDIPLIRCGFPIHDRIGAQRILHLGYRGTTALFDIITNALMQVKQDRSPLGYKYI